MDAATGRASRGDEAGLLEDPQMLGRRLTADPQIVPQCSGIVGPVAEGLEDPPPRRVSEG